MSGGEVRNETEGQPDTTGRDPADPRQLAPKTLGKSEASARPIRAAPSVKPSIPTCFIMSVTGTPADLASDFGKGRPSISRP